MPSFLEPQYEVESSKMFDDILSPKTNIVENCKLYLIPKYMDYENNIKNFDENIYFKNKNMNNDTIFDDKIDNFCNFITLYKEVEEEDLKKTQMLLNSKNKKNNQNTGYSYNVNNFQKQKVAKVWNSHVPKSNDEKLNSLIESYLNKICDESYKKISIDFINELINIQDIFYFDIISKKIVDKCVMDNKYQHLYIQLCSKMWSNRQIHYNLAHIQEENKKYYWQHKYENMNQKYGPFNSEMDAKMNIFYTLNFKKYFMNYIQQLFIHKNVDFTHIDNDEEFFLHKRQFMVIIEILGIMYNEKYINIDILHLVIMKLFHMNDIGTTISPIEIDGILNIFKIMDTYKNVHKINDYFKAPIFDEYFNYITQIENLPSFNLRTKYFLADCKDILKENKKLTLSLSNDNIAKNENKEVNIIEQFINEKKKNNSNIMISIYTKSNEENKNNILYEVIYRFCEANMRDDIYENFLRTIFENEDKSTKTQKINKKDIKLLENSIHKIIMNLNEIYIDNPNIVSILKKFIEFIETFEIFDLELHNKFNELIDTQAKLINDDSDDDNFF